MSRTVAKPFVCLGLLALLAALAAPAAAQTHSWTYSPLTAVGGGPSGPASSKIMVEPFCCPSTAIVVTSSTKVEEGDFQWVELGLPGPTGPEIASVEVCYSLKAAEPGTTYISQTRLTDMTTPDAAHVKMDDGTDRKDPGPTCSVSRAGFTPTGTVTLALKVVFGRAGDEIRIGMVKLDRVPVKMEKRMKLKEKKPMKEKGAAP
jgi:hypothetical protein